MGESDRVRVAAWELKYFLRNGGPGLAHPPLFCAKSAESLEKKRVEILVSAKRIRKSMKKKTAKWRGMMEMRTHCKNDKQRTYGRDLFIIK